MSIKKCMGRCGLEKELDCFSKGKNQCKPCKAELSKEWREKNPEKSKEGCKRWRENNPEKVKDNIKNWKLKNPDYSKNWEKEHKEERAADNKKWRQEHKKEIVKWEEEHKEERSEQRNALNREKRKADPSLRLRNSISGRVWEILKSQGSSKAGNSVLKFLPYSIRELKLHVESLFEPWMNWNNRGIYKSKSWDDNDLTTWKWQLDHIIPQSDLPYSSMEEDNFKRCWDLSNLRPLSAKQNQLDGATKIRHIKKVVAK